RRGTPTRFHRLVRKGAARYPEQKVHADIEPVGPAPTLAAPLLHYTSRSLTAYVEKLHRYADWGAEDLARRGHRSSPLTAVMRAGWRFFRTFVVQGGFLDGGAGLVVCRLQAYGTFLKWTRLWEIQKKKGF